MDWWLRRLVKVACLTRDFDSPHGVHLDATVGRGWAHPALWAHYSAGHTGMCLRFSRQRLIDALAAQYGSSAQVYADNVDYEVDPWPAPAALAAGHVTEFGLDATMLDYISEYRRELLFTKNSDWAPEAEFRVVVIGTDLAPSYLDVASCLTGVFLGESFSSNQWDVVNEILDSTPNVEVFQLTYFGKVFRAFPPGPSSQPPASTARREGTLSERRAALTAAKQSRETAEAAARSHVQPLLDAMAADLRSLRDELAERSDLEAILVGSALAIPGERAQRAPGVPGEVIDYQTGWVVSLHFAPAVSSRYGSHTVHNYEVHLGIAVLPDGTCRLDAVLRMMRTQLGVVSPEARELWREGPHEI